ncbi:MAG: YgjV family protein [Clostridia bacterium]|nr:YgjV family protein [Clostridia bacterium]
MDQIISWISVYLSQPTNLITLISGIAVCVCIVASMQTKNIKYTMLFQLLCNGFGMVSYLVGDDFSGFGVFLVATAQSLLFFLLRLFDKEAPRWIYPIIFAAYIGCSLFTLKSALDIVPMLAALLCGLALMQKKPSAYRIIILLNGALWLIYDIYVQSYGMLISHIITVVSALVGIVRIDLLKK